MKGDCFNTGNSYCSGSHRHSCRLVEERDRTLSVQRFSGPLSISRFLASASFPVPPPGDGPPQHCSIEPSFRLPELPVYGHGAVHRGGAVRSYRYEGDTRFVLDVTAGGNLLY